MKLLFCQSCSDIISPNQDARHPRWCRCGSHAVWWENPFTGEIRVHHKRAQRGGAMLIGLHNGILSAAEMRTTRSTVEALLASTPDTYIFKQANSLVIKFAPGMSSDSAWAEALPGQQAAMPDTLGPPDPPRGDRNREFG